MKLLILCVLLAACSHTETEPEAWYHACIAGSEIVERRPAVFKKIVFPSGGYEESLISSWGVSIGAQVWCQHLCNEKYGQDCGKVWGRDTEDMEIDAIYFGYIFDGRDYLLDSCPNKNLARKLRRTAVEIRKTYDKEAK